MNNKQSKFAVIPVLFGFFVMGFVDIVGISTNYVKQDFALSDTLAGLLPMMVFLWFAVLSVPTSMIMNAIGRKKTVMVSLLITFVALVIPYVAYSFTTILIAFALLGIGNTIIQVSLNPLLTNVVNGEKLTSVLTLGQFMKAIASFIGPIIAGFASTSLDNWKLTFPIFAIVTILSCLWLWFTSIEEEVATTQSSSFAQIFSLLKDSTILMFFVGIIFVVGIDVGLNVYLPKIFMEKAGLPLEKAGLGTSLYFAARTIGTFAGALLLMKLPGRKFYIWSMLVGIVAMGLMFLLSGVWPMRILTFILGLAVANVFSIIFSAALRKKSEHANEVSGLLIMGVAGGAILPPIMGIASDLVGLTGAIAILFLSFIYLLYCALKMK